MKTLISLLMITTLSCTSLFSQAPQAINYQAVIRGSAGYLLSNTDVNVKISIQQDSIGGAVKYSENHATTTTVYGIVNLAIGQGTVLSGSFDTIPWEDSDHFIKIEMDTTDGSNYYDMSTTQLLSVPYALESDHSSSLTLTDSQGDKYNVVVDTSGSLQVILVWTACGDSLYDYRDGKYYQTVLIGTQCWISQNLNVGTRINANKNPADDSIIEKYCYDDNEDYCDTLGGLYQWYEAMQYVTTEGTQGICPDGWHIPTDDEFKILEGTVDNQYGVGDPIWETEGFRGSDVGLNLKSTSRWINDGNGTNLFGFTALPGGLRGYQGGTDLLGSDAYFWSSGEASGSHAWLRVLFYPEYRVSRNHFYYSWGLSVRCLQD